jgi:hypothetical protein
VCLAGARAAHDRILQKNSSAKLRVYAVWIGYYSWDTKGDIDPGILRDSRATQYWDPDKVVGKWFANEVAGRRGGVSWDVYFLYPPDSQWDGAPTNLLRTASPVIDDIDALNARLSTS